jgi:hypothetical protein
MDFVEELLAEWTELARRTKSKGLEMLHALQRRIVREVEDKENIGETPGDIDGVAPMPPGQEKERTGPRSTLPECPERPDSERLEGDLVHKEDVNNPWNRLVLENIDNSLFAAGSAIQSPLPIVKSRVPEKIGRKTKHPVQLERTEEMKGGVEMDMEEAGDNRVIKGEDDDLPDTAEERKPIPRRRIFRAMALESLKGSRLKEPSAVAYPGRGGGVHFLSPRRRLANGGRTEKLAGSGPLTTAKKNVEVKSNADLMSAFQLFKKRHQDRVNESMLNTNSGAAAHKDCEFRKPIFNPSSMPVKSILSSQQSGELLYKQSIDGQLAVAQPWPPQHLYKPETIIPKLNEDDTAESSHVIPDFAKDPAISFRVKGQDHDVLQKYFACGSQIDVELLFPHINNVSNDSPNKWPSGPRNNAQT